MHKIKETRLTKEQAHKVITSDLFVKVKTQSKKHVIEYAKAYLKKHGDYKHTDTNRENRRHMYGYEHSHRGYREDLKDQHHDVMRDETLDLHI